MATSARSPSRPSVVLRLQRSAGTFSTAALARMELDLPWVGDLEAAERSWLGMIVSAGVKSFVDWYRDPASAPLIRSDVFGAAPRALAGVISLQQTVELVRMTIEVVEENLAEVVGDDAPELRAALDTYAREVAFATAEVYARAAEERGAWDARLEALVVDQLLRGEADDAVDSRAGALGWDGTGRVVVVMGGLGGPGGASAIDRARHRAAEEGLHCLCAVQGDRLVVVLGGVEADGSPAYTLAEGFAPGPVVIGPVVASLRQAGASAKAAAAALRAVRGRADAPRPVAADDLLPERALSGDAAARAQLVSEVAVPLDAASGGLRVTVETYLAQGGSLEATARALFVHANTVRYRLRRVQELTGLSPVDPRAAWTLQCALTLGRLDGVLSQPDLTL